jgi:hypothetical protein
MPDFNFDANEVEPSITFELIPAGWYNAKVDSTEFKPTRAGTGEYLQITWKIVDGAYEGRLVWDRLNLNNPNNQAVEIAKRHLSALCRAVGVWKLSTTEELHNKICQIKLSARPATDNWDATNDVKGFRSADVAVPPTGEASNPKDSKNAKEDELPPWA